MSRFACALLALAAFALNATAADGDNKNRKVGKADPGAMLQKLDANKDGKISKDEFMKIADKAKDKGAGDKAAGFLEKLFQKLDANNDGALSLEELKKMQDLRGQLRKKKEQQ
jgi:Ca2+-binding EF-hand superfamily protein